MVSLVNKSILQSFIITGVQLERGGELRDLSCPSRKPEKSSLISRKSAQMVAI